MGFDVVALPFKIGERVFCVIHGKDKIVEDVIWDYDIWSIRDGVKLRIRLENFNDYVIAQAGKTVFRTREEAEAALRERN